MSLLSLRVQPRGMLSVLISGLLLMIIIRVLLPVHKINLTEEHIARPIPTLSDRQFVVDKSGLSSAEERTRRELFWYREELINSVHGRWREVGYPLLPQHTCYAYQSPEWWKPSWRFISATTANNAAHARYTEGSTRAPRAITS